MGIALEFKFMEYLSVKVDIKELYVKARRLKFYNVKTYQLKYYSVKSWKNNILIL